MVLKWLTAITGYTTGQPTEFFTGAQMANCHNWLHYRSAEFFIGAEMATCHNWLHHRSADSFSLVLKWLPVITGYTTGQLTDSFSLVLKWLTAITGYITGQLTVFHWC